MPRRGRRRRRGSRNNTNSNSSNLVSTPRSVLPGPSVINFNGPIVPRNYRLQRDVHTLALCQAAVLTSDGTGSITTVYGSNPASYPSWSSIATVFDEFRTLGVRVEYSPFDRFNRGTVDTAPIMLVIDQNSSAALGSTSDAASYGSVNMKSLDDNWSREARMSGFNDAQWQSTGSPSSVFFIKTFVTGLDASVSYGQILIHHLVQFRGLGI